MGWGREAATRGAACAGPRVLAAVFPAPGCGGRRGRLGWGAGLEAEPREKEAAGGGRERSWGRRACGGGAGGIHFG